MKHFYIFLFLLLFCSSSFAQQQVAGGAVDNIKEQISLNSFNNKFRIDNISAILPDYTFSTTTYTFSDIVIFSYFNESYFYLVNQAGQKIDSVMLNEDEYYVFSTGSGVFQIDGNKSFTVLIGDPVSNAWMGYYAVNESGSPLSTKLNTFMPERYYGSEHFIVFAYFDDTEVTVYNASDSVLAGVALLNKGENLTLNNLDRDFVSVLSSKPVSALSYSDQGYFVPASNGSFAGMEFFGFSGYVGNWANSIIVTAYSDSTNYVVVNSTTGDTLDSGILSIGEISQTLITADTYWEVISDKSVTVSNTPYAGWSGNYYYLTRQIDESGMGIGTHFIIPVIGGTFDIFSFADDNEIIMINITTGDTVYTGTLQNGMHQNLSSEKSLYEVFSAGGISIIHSWGGSAGADFVPLNFAVGLPDLSISSADMRFNPDTDQREAEDPIMINATVHNYGFETAYNVPFQFFDGDPRGGYAIGPVIYADSIPPAASHTFSMEWTVPSFPEFHAVFGMVDGDDFIIESNSSNNFAFKFLIPNEDLLPPLSTVVDAPSSVAVVADTLEFDTFQIEVDIFNTGTVSATNSMVMLQLPEFLSTMDSLTVNLGTIEQQLSDDFTWTVHIDSLPPLITAFFYSVYVAADSVPVKWVNRMLIIDDPSRITSLLEEKQAVMPETIILYQNYPNPFNNSTVLSYQLLQNSKTELRIYDVLGHEVQTLVDAYQSAGNHTVLFDGENLSSGIFFARLIVNGRDAAIQKMTLLK